MTNEKLEKAIIYHDEENRTEILDTFFDCPHCSKKINVELRAKKWEPQEELVEMEYDKEGIPTDEMQEILEQIEEQEAQMSGLSEV